MEDYSGKRKRKSKRIIKKLLPQQQGKTSNKITRVL